MNNYRKLFVQKIIAYSISKISRIVYNYSFKKISYRQFTTQYKSEFNYVNNVFDHFKKQWLLKLTSIGVLAGIASHGSIRAQCQEFSMEDIDETQVNLKPIEFKESINLSHSSLLRAAGRVCTDGAVQLLHRSTAASQDKSEQYRQSLHKVMNLLEYCINIISDKNQHDNLWEHVIAARNEMEAIKQQLMDLNILFDYSCLTLENAAMAAYISGANFSASVSQQLITSAKQELENERSKNATLENQYTIIVADHVRALAGNQSQGNNNESESKSQEHDTNETKNPQSQVDKNSEILLKDSVIQPEINKEGHYIIEGPSKEYVDVSEEDENKADNQNIKETNDNDEENMSQNIESNWMSGFSEHVEYNEREDEEVLSF